MRRYIAISIVFLLVASLAAPQSAQEVTRHKSPDGKTIAVITSTRASNAEHESEVEFRSDSGEVLTKKDYSSDDGTHGYGVTKATWTPDSRFFVYSLENSGAHSPEHSPVQFFDRKQNNIFSLDDALNDTVMNPQFTVNAPDKITVQLLFSRKQVTLSLSSLTPKQ